MLFDLGPISKRKVMKVNTRMARRMVKVIE